MADALLLPVGMPFAFNGAGFSFNNGAYNNTTSAYSVTFRSLTTDPITRLGLRCGGITGTPPTYQISLQGVGTNGSADGSIKASGNAKATFLGGSLTSPGFNWLTLTSSYTPSRGEKLALVFQYSSGSVDTSNYIDVTDRFGGTTYRSNKFPAYSSGNVSPPPGSRQQYTPIFGYGTATTAYGYPVSGSLAQTINSGATAEAGCKFALPSGWGSTYKVAGARFGFGTTIVAKTLTCSLYTGGGASDTTALQTVDADTDDFTTSAGYLDFMFDEATLSTLTFGSTYRVAVSTADASDQVINGMTVAAAADLTAYQMGEQFSLSTRAGGNWTDTTTSRLFCELILSEIAVPTPGGGGSVVGSSVVRGGL